jgi:hypothetical protein
MAGHYLLAAIIMYWHKKHLGQSKAAQHRTVLD